MANSTDLLIPLARVADTILIQICIEVENLLAEGTPGEQRVAPQQLKDRFGYSNKLPWFW